MRCADDGAGALAIMLVDDHVMLASSLAEVLSSVDGLVVVGVAHSAAEALTKAASIAPDVVLLDYRLPDADGVITATRLHDLLPEAHLLMLTGVGADAHLAIRAFSAGCSGFLTKDRPIGELVAAIRSVAAGEEVVTPAVLAQIVGDPAAPRLSPIGLSSRQQEVLEALAAGKSDKEIASALGVSLNTARNHVRNVLHEMGVHSRLEAVVTAVRRGDITV